MKKMVKVILAAAAVVALAVPAMGADKLIVNNTNGTAGFKVDDTGKLTIRNLGNTADVFTVDNAGNISVPGGLKYDNTSKFMGLGVDTPMAVFHGYFTSAAPPFVLERSLDTNGAVGLTATNFAGTGGGNSPATLIGSGMIFASSRGSKAVPADLVPGDRIGYLVFGGFAGGTQRNTGAINGMVDAGTVSSTSLPTYLQFMTTANGSTARAERLRIAGDGRIRLSNQPAAPVSGTTACTAGDMILDAANSKLYLCTAAPNTWKSLTFL